MEISLLRKDFFDRPEVLGLSCDYRVLLAGCTVNTSRKASGVTFFSPATAAALGFADFSAVTKALKIMDDEGLIIFDEKTFEVLPADHYLINEMGVGSFFSRHGRNGIELIKSDRVREARKEMEGVEVVERIPAWSVLSNQLVSLAARGLMVSDLAIALCLYCNPTLSRARVGLLNVAMLASMTAQTVDAAERGIKNVEKLGLVKVDWRTGEYICQKWASVPRGMKEKEAAKAYSSISSKVLKKHFKKIIFSQEIFDSKKLFSEISLESKTCDLVDVNSTLVNSTSLHSTARSRPADAAPAAVAASKSEEGGGGGVLFSAEERQKAKTLLSTNWSWNEAEVALNIITKNAVSHDAAQLAAAVIAAADPAKIKAREAFWLSTIKKANSGELAPPRAGKHHNLQAGSGDPVEAVMSRISGVSFKDEQAIRDALTKSVELFTAKYLAVYSKSAPEHLVELAQAIHHAEEVAA